MALQADKDPDRYLEQIALAFAEKAMKPANYAIPDDFDSYERFLDIIPDLEKSSSPGYPHCLGASTIGEWLKWDGIKASPHRLRELWYETQLVLSGEYDAVFKAFIKQEPHKIAKARAGRWRIIVGFPLPVQVAWHMVFGSGNTAMVEASYDIPTQFGLKLTQGYWKDYLRLWKARKYNAGTDVSAFDFGVTWRKIEELVLELRVRMARGSRLREWKVLAHRLYEQAYCNSKILFPSGRIYKLMVNAVEKSGSPNTIADNSMLRFIEAIIVYMMLDIKPIVPPVSVGDDALERIPPDVSVEAFREAYLKRGWVLKGIEFGLEFVGHRFDDTGPQPLYVAKHLWNYFYTSPVIIPSYLDSMLHLYAKSPLLEFWIRLAEEHGLSPMSKSFYGVWYDTDYDDLSWLNNLNLASLAARQ